MDNSIDSGFRGKNINLMDVNRSAAVVSMPQQDEEMGENVFSTQHHKDTLDEEVTETLVRDRLTILEERV
jgi:hypothetical protein